MFCTEENKESSDPRFINLNISDNEKVAFKHIVQVTIDAYLKIIGSTLENEKYTAEQLRELKESKEKTSHYFKQFTDLSTTIANSKVGAKFVGQPNEFIQFVDFMANSLEDLQRKTQQMTNEETKLNNESVFGTNEEIIDNIHDINFYQTTTTDMLRNNIEFDFNTNYFEFCNFLYKFKKSDDIFEHIVKNEKVYEYTIDPSINNGNSKLIEISAGMKPVDDRDHTLIMLQMNKDLRIVVESLLDEIQVLDIIAKLNTQYESRSNELSTECDNQLTLLKEELLQQSKEKEELLELSKESKKELEKQTEESQQIIAVLKSNLEKAQVTYAITKTTEEESQQIIAELKSNLEKVQETVPKITEEESSEGERSVLPPETLNILKEYFGKFVEINNLHLVRKQLETIDKATIDDEIINKLNSAMKDKLIYNNKSLFNEEIKKKIGSNTTSETPMIMFIKSIEKLKEYYHKEKGNLDNLTHYDKKEKQVTSSSDTFTSLLIQIYNNKDNNEERITIEQILDDIFKREHFVTYVALLYGNITKKFQVIVNVFNTYINEKEQKWTCDKNDKPCIISELPEDKKSEKPPEYGGEFDNVYLPKKGEHQFKSKGEKLFKSAPETDQKDKIYPNSLLN
jgi:hypothetical protein